MSAPDVGTVRWRYTFCDLLTDQPLAVLPLTGVDLTETIGDKAPGNARVPLTSAAVRAQDPWTATQQRRTICYAQRVLTRAGVEAAAPVLWHGIVWGRTRSKRELSLRMSTPESYYARRLIRADRTFTATDDAEILRGIFRDSEAAASGSLGLRYTADPAGVLSDRTLIGTDLKTVLEIAQSIARAGDGLDWRIAPGLDPATGAFTKTLEIAPRLGRRGVGELAWQSRSQGRAQNELVGYSMEEDGTDVANLVIGMGSGQPPNQLRSTAVNAAELTGGYPLLESAYSGGEELQEQDSLDRHTLGVLAAGAENETTVTGVTVRGDRFPTTDRYGLGDEVLLHLNDPLQPVPRILAGRVTTRRIQPAEPGRTERVSLELGAT